MCMPVKQPLFASVCSHMLAFCQRSHALSPNLAAVDASLTDMLLANGSRTRRMTGMVPKLHIAKEAPTSWRRGSFFKGVATLFLKVWL